LELFLWWRWRRFTTSWVHAFCTNRYWSINSRHFYREEGLV